MKLARASARLSPRGSNTRRARKKPGQRKAVGDVLRRRLVRGGLAQKCRQCEQPVAPRFARLPRDRASGFWRHIDEIGLDSARRASGKIESKAQLCQKLELEAHHAGCSAARIEEPVEHLRKRGVNLRMRVALG